MLYQNTSFFKLFNSSKKQINEIVAEALKYIQAYVKTHMNRSYFIVAKIASKAIKFVDFVVVLFFYNK